MSLHTLLPPLPLSLADNVARYDITEPLVKALQSKCPVDTFLLPKEQKVPHVALLRHMGPPAYMDVVETFLGEI